MRIRVFLAFMVIAGVIARGQKISFTDSAALADLYALRKKEFAVFEKHHGSYIQTRNVRMHYVTWGNPSGKPIFWLHGTGSNAYEIADIADSLSFRGFYVIAIDYYGHGFTPFPDHQVSLYHVADDLYYLMDALQIKRAVVGGASRGGAIATAFYDSYPERVAGIVLEDGGSVPWSATDHQQPTDSLAKRVEQNFQNRDMEPEFDSEYQCFLNTCAVAIADGSIFTARAPFYRFFARVKKNKGGKWVADPGLADFVCVKTPEQLLALKQRTLGADNLFCISNEQLNPMVVYRNLTVPILIYDPVYPNDDLPFEAENHKLQQMHPALITHRIYENTRHEVKLHRPREYLQDLLPFLVKTVSGG